MTHACAEPGAHPARFSLRFDARQARPYWTLIRRARYMKA